MNLKYFSENSISNAVLLFIAFSIDFKELYQSKQQHSKSYIIYFIIPNLSIATLLTTKPNWFFQTNQLTIKLTKQWRIHKWERSTPLQWPQGFKFKVRLRISRKIGRMKQNPNIGGRKIRLEKKYFVTGSLWHSCYIE